jgi:hypothetical protein
MLFYLTANTPVGLQGLLRGYHGIQGHLKGQLHETLSSIDVSVYVSPVFVARQQSRKRSSASKISVCNSEIVGNVIYCQVHIFVRGISDGLFITLSFLGNGLVKRFRANE